MGSRHPHGVVGKRPAVHLLDRDRIEPTSGDTVSGRPVRESNARPAAPAQPRTSLSRAVVARFGQPYERARPAQKRIPVWHRIDAFGDPPRAG